MAHSTLLSTDRDLPLSVVIVAFNIPREIARTLYSLSTAYQRDVAADDYEIIVVDNGSQPALDPGIVASLRGNFRIIRIDDAPTSPAHAINRGLAQARGHVVGVMIDGARLATPGLLAFGLRGAGLHKTAIVASLGWYLGHDFQTWSQASGYDREREDALLASIDWPADGYRLFEIGTMDESSTDGWFHTIAESNALFLTKRSWNLLGGFDERFASAGGGLVNLDTYARALALDDARLVVLLGEATFHQLHGGTNTNTTPRKQVENFERWAREYETIRGRPYGVPALQTQPTFLGILPAGPLERFVRAAVAPIVADDRGREPDVRAEPGTLAHLARVALDERRFAAAAGIARLAAERGIHGGGIERILSLVCSRVNVDGPPDFERSTYHLALGDAHGLLGERELAERNYRLALAAEPDLGEAHVGLSALRMPGDNYLVWLERLYATLTPETVLEIGVYEGASLARVRPPTIAIGVDPHPKLIHTISAQTHIFAETSDAFFARNGAEPFLRRRPLSIGFIDGLHLFEQALRDFIFLEALCGPESIIAMHDTVPLDEVTQRRVRETDFHTGDVWKVVLALKTFRPELSVTTIATAPTGLTLVAGLDPGSRVLADRFDEIVARFVDIPYAESIPQLYDALGLVPNDWDVVAAKLRSLHLLPTSEFTRLGDKSGIGSYHVEREQPPLSTDETEIVNRFHDLYYRRWLDGTDTINVSWLGYETLKCPLDLWMYQELLTRVRPDVVIETGTHHGGSALYIAIMLDMIGRGRVITIDVDGTPERPQHPRIDYITGSSTSPQTLAEVRRLVGDGRVLVMLDSDHSAAHVYEEIVAYRPLLRTGDYLIVEDTNVNGHPAYPDYGPGPWEAVDRILTETNDFYVDHRPERLLMTLNPRGFLRRI